jgi:subtilisin family serine protease
LTLSRKIQFEILKIPTQWMSPATVLHALALSISVAPEAEIYSVRVLGKDMRGRAIQFAAGLDWAIENGMQVINLSLSTSKEDYFALFHDLADQAYFKNINLVSAVNNVPAPSYPSQYSSVISVAAHDGHDPFTYYYNPSPPVEFGALG